MRLGPHMMFLGWQVADWAAVVTFLSAIIGAVVWLVKKIIVDPSVERMMYSNKILNNTIHALGEKVDGIGGAADIIHKDHEHRLNDHREHLARHDEEIRTLFERTDKKERNHEN